MGTVRDLSVEAERVELEPGATVLLYTDGLIERRDTPIDEDIEELRRVFEKRAARARGVPRPRHRDARAAGRRATTSRSSRCASPAEPVAACGSPAKLKHVGTGKHVLEVRAIDAAGRPDATPASKKFKIRR